MEEKLIKIFQKATYEPESALVDCVWSCVIKKDNQSIKVKQWTFALAGIFSLAGLAEATKILSSDLTQSGFYKYFSLLFGGGAMLSYWKELLFSLAESLPTMSIVLTLSLLFAFFFSVRHFMRQIGESNRLAKRQLLF